MQTLLRFCGGWLNWSSSQALSEDLDYLAAAYAGYGETLQLIFGSNKEDTLPEVSRGADGAPIQLTPNVFDSQFDQGVPFEIRRKSMTPGNSNG